MNTEITIPKQTIHQIWLGPELEAEDKKLVEATFKTCGKSGIGYKMWGLQDIISTFPHDEIYQLWERLWASIPLPAIMAASVDYFKWKVLSLTPENEISIYLDVDVEMMRKEKGRKPYTIPATDSFISFGASMDINVPSVCYLQVYGPKAAQIAVHEADKLLGGINIDSSTFLSDFFSDCGNGLRNGKYSLGSAWVMDKLIPRLEEAELSADISPVTIFSQYGQAPETLLYHHERNYATGGESSAEGITNKKQENLERVKKIEEEREKRKKKVIIMMSSAGSYDDSVERTLGLIDAKAIRDIQRRTTFGKASEHPDLDYYFVLGLGRQELDRGEELRPEFYTAQIQEGKEREGQRLYESMKWIGMTSGYSFLFFCQDDCYIHIPRLLDYVSRKEAGGKIGYGRDTHTGILLPAALVRKLIQAEIDPPKEGEDFGNWLHRAVEVVDGEIKEEDKFSGEKDGYPAPTNGKITTHGVNPFDLVALAGMNE